MSETWKKSALGELLTTHFDGAWGEPSTNSGGDVPILRSTEMRGGNLVFDTAEMRSLPAKTIEKKKLLPGDILVNKSSGSAHLVGLSVLFPTPPDNRSYLCSNFVHCLRPNQTEVEPEFLSLTLLSPQFREQVFRAQNTTSGLRNLNLTEYLAAKIIYPSRPEQRRVVGRIKECLSRVEEMQRLREEMEAEIAVLENGWLRQRFAELATEWPQEELAELADIKGGGSLPKGTPASAQPNDWLLVKVGDMNLPGNELVISSAREYLQAGDSDKAWPVGTIVFPKRGGAIATNKKGLLGRLALLDPNLMGVIADPKKMRAEFLLAQFMMLDLATLSSGSTVPQLNRKDLAPLPFVVPDLPTQDTVIEQAKNFSTKAREMAMENACSAEFAALRESILREAFAGNL